jgi:hypothetical protein
MEAVKCDPFKNVPKIETLAFHMSLTMKEK